MAKKYNCTKLTISRNLRKHYGEEIYKDLFEKSKSLKQFVSKESDNLKKVIDNRKINKKLRRR